MANAYENLLKAYVQGIGDDGVGDDGVFVGDDGIAYAPIGYATVGDDGVGDDGIGDDGVGDDGIGAGRRRRRRAAPRRPAAAAMARAVMKASQDPYDIVYARAFKERGIALPEEQVVMFEDPVGAVGPIDISQQSPLPYDLTSLLTSGAVASIFNAQIVISGRPIIGYPNIALDGYQRDSINARVSPVVIPAGVPVRLLGTMTGAGGGFRVVLKGTAIRQANKFAHI